MAIGYDPADANKTIFHIAYPKDNADCMYTRADLSTIDALDADLGDLVFTKSDGVTVGDEAISYVPSGVVFQGTIVLDRNDDPHIIFSGDGGADTFGDKTPYHIYFKSAAATWGPIPPQRLMAELEQSWGMPEMVFDQNNRGYYFLDKNDPYGAATFGTWEPPANSTSATDFGTLNATGEVYGFGGALDLIDENFSNLEVTSDDDLYLPQADVDDANDVIYVVANTNSYSSGQGGDIWVLALENASQYSHTAPLSDMDWTVYRELTSDGIGLGDVGADMVYDPASSHIDVFWSGAGAQTNEAQYLDASVPPAAIDAAALLVAYELATDKPTVNKGDVITISGILKNNGTNPIPPVPVIAQVLDSLGTAVFTGNFTAPPLGPGLETPVIEFGTWLVAGDRQRYSVTLEVALANDEATYNDKVGTSFYAYPAIDETYAFDTFDDTVEFGAFAPVFYQDGTALVAGLPNANGWTTIDSSHGTFGDARDDYLSTWYLSSSAINDLDLNFSIRHMFGWRGIAPLDSLFGDIPPPAGYTDSSYAQPQNELLYSPFYSLGDDESLADSVQIRFQWKNPNNDGSYGTWDIDNFYLVARGPQVILSFDDAVNASLEQGDINSPMIANVDLSIDGGVTWLPVIHREATLAGTVDERSIDGLAFAELDITSLVSTNAPPEAFDLVGPAAGDTIFVTADNLSDSFSYSWNAAVDQDPVTYTFSLQSTELGDETFDTTATTFSVGYQEVYDEMVAAGVAIATISWNVSATDGIATVASANGPRDLTFDASAVGIDGDLAIPVVYALSQNYPNPFNPSTRIQFSVPKATQVRLFVHNLLGQNVKTLVNGFITPGTHTVTLEASDLSAGIYFYTLKTADFTETKKLVLLK